MVGLVRVSKVGGRGDDLLSPDLQRTAITEYAERNGMLVERWVEALDESGSQNRSSWWRRLDQVIEWVEEKEVDGVLVWKYSRAARNRRRWAVALDRIEAAGGVLESATEQLDTTTPTGRLARGMLAEMAAWEAEVRGEQWREVFANRLARGLPASGKPRWGYTYSRETGFVPDPDLAPVVRECYERFVAGETAAQICKWLHSIGVTGTSGGYWTQQNLHTYMDSGFAAGVLTHNGERYRGAHEPIVPPSLFADYQRVRETTRRKNPWARRAAHPLAGLIRCGLCGGSACHSRMGKGTELKDYRYRCCLAKTIGSQACSGPTITDEKAFGLVVKWLQGVASEVDKKAAAVEGQRKHLTDSRAKVARLRRQVTRLDESLARLAVQSALLPQRAYAIAEGELLDQREAAERALLEAENDAAASLSAPAAKTARSILAVWDEARMADPTGLRDVLAALIRVIEIVRDENGKATLVITPRWAIRP